MESVKSVEYRGLSRTGEERPGTPDPLFDFTLDDLNLLIGGHEEHEDAPSVIWTEASVQSTLASVISTDPSIISTQASVTSTIPSVLIIEEVDLRYQCRCGTKMGIQERVATQDLQPATPHHTSAMHPDGHLWGFNRNKREEYSYISILS